MKPWAVGDVVSICCALVYLPGLASHRSGAECRLPQCSRLGILLGTGLSLGTLLLVVIDPFRQLAGFTDLLLTIALDEGRATLWWSAAIAIIYLVKDLFVPPPTTTT